MKLKISHITFFAFIMVLFIFCLSAGKNEIAELTNEASLISKKKNESNSALYQPNAVEGVSYTVSALDLPNYMSFAGEQVKLDDFDVRERIDKELMISTFWHSNTMRLMKLSNRYFPIIEPILRKNGIPDDFKYLVVAESGFEPVTSPAGAKGYWQFLKATGKELGLEINSEVDERYHIEKSTEAACKYIKSAKNKFGNYTMAAASFNMGRSALLKQVNRQKQKNYYDLLVYDETARYLPRIIAYKTIFEDPLKYGFDIRQDQLYPPLNYKEIKVSKSVSNWAVWAKKYGISYKTLKFYNPWLRENNLTVIKNRYKIKVPK